MAVEISESVRKVQKFSRYARGFCIFFFITLGLVFLLGASTVLFGAGMPGAKISFGPYAITGDHFLTPAATSVGNHRAGRHIRDPLHRVVPSVPAVPQLHRGMHLHA